MTAKGISARDIEDQLRDIYGVDASPSPIGRKINNNLPDMMKGQGHPLSAVYPIVFIDGIIFKSLRKNS